MPKTDMPKSFPTSGFPTGSQCSECGRAILPEHVDAEGRCVFCQPGDVEDLTSARPATETALEGAVEPQAAPSDPVEAAEPPPSTQRP